MKNFKSKLAEKAGFTLVELIVVIAILGILAGVAVPSYTGYVNKANDAAVESQLAAIKTAGEAAATLSNKELVSIDVDNTGKITLNPTDANIVADFETFSGLDVDGGSTTELGKALAASNTYKSKGAEYTPAGGWTVGS
ncbi:MAG: type II secretion system protein [Firmicutes bacterium]|nr:type II secretion system protein [Bacillota bacterium]